MLAALAGLRNRLLFCLLLVLVCIPFSHAGTLDDLNKAASDAFGKALAHKASEAAKLKANKKLAAKLNQRLLSDSARNQCVFKSGNSEPDTSCERKSKRLAAAMLRAKQTMQRAGAECNFTLSSHAYSVDGGEPDKSLAKKRAQAISKLLAAHGVEEKILDIDTATERTSGKLARATGRDHYEVQIKL